MEAIADIVSEWETKTVAKTLEQAQKRNRQYYWGEGCKYHPESPLYTRTQYCVQCTREASAAYRSIELARKQEKQNLEAIKLEEWRERERLRIKERLERDGR